MHVILPVILVLSSFSHDLTKPKDLNAFCCSVDSLFDSLSQVTESDLQVSDKTCKNEPSLLKKYLFSLWLGV